MSPSFPADDQLIEGDTWAALGVFGGVAERQEGVGDECGRETIEISHRPCSGYSGSAIASEMRVIVIVAV